MLTCFSWSFPKDLKIISHRIIGFIENLLIVHCKQCCLTNSITQLKHYSDYTKLRTLSIQRTLGYVSRFISSKTACNIVLNWEFQLVVLLSYCWLSLWLFALAVFKTALVSSLLQVILNSCEGFLVDLYRMFQKLFFKALQELFVAFQVNTE